MPTEFTNWNLAEFEALLARHRKWTMAMPPADVLGATQAMSVFLGKYGGAMVAQLHDGILLKQRIRDEIEHTTLMEQSRMILGRLLDDITPAETPSSPSPSSSPSSTEVEDALVNRQNWQSVFSSSLPQLNRLASLYPGIFEASVTSSSIYLISVLVQMALEIESYEKAAAANADWWRIMDAIQELGKTDAAYRDAWVMVMTYRGSQRDK
jgi:hypothetical protein